jgi:hypothetical protein
MSIVSVSGLNIADDSRSISSATTSSRNHTIKRITNPGAALDKWSASTVEQHTFVQFIPQPPSKQSLPQQQYIDHFCEYCFKPLEREKQAYQCDACAYVCHRNCRNAVNLSCASTMGASISGEAANITKIKELVDGINSSHINNNHSSSPIETLYKLQVKLKHLQDELAVSRNIRDGLERIYRAKEESLAKMAGATIASAAGSLALFQSQLQESERKVRNMEQDYQSHRISHAIIASRCPIIIANGSAKLAIDEEHDEGVSENAKVAFNALLQSVAIDAVDIDVQVPVAEDKHQDPAFAISIQAPSLLITARQLLELFFEHPVLDSRPDLLINRDQYGLCLLVGEDESKTNAILIDAK